MSTTSVPRMPLGRSQNTISALQMHRHGIIVCDEPATDELRVGTYKYFKDIEKDNLI